MTYVRQTFSLIMALRMASDCFADEENSSNNISPMFIVTKTHKNNSLSISADLLINLLAQLGIQTFNISFVKLFHFPSSKLKRCCN